MQGGGGDTTVIEKPFLIKWSRSDWIYFPPDKPGVEMALTEWVKANEIDVEHPTLRWMSKKDLKRFWKKSRGGNRGW